jgi:hypothetical protein
MKSRVRMFAPALVSILLVGAPQLNAQITNAIIAHIHHNFIIGNTTLPPGEYTFRMMQGSDLQLMTATSQNDKTSVEFLVREAIDDHTPNHSELTFRKYGSAEFLSRIFESGSKSGVSVDETSHQETRLKKQGQSGTEHSEEQK